MAQDVVQLLFVGDAPALLAKYQEGVRRYRQSGGVAPVQVSVGQGEEGLMVTLVWGEGVTHEELGAFMMGLIGELGLPRPRATHGTLVTASWAELTASNPIGGELARH